tara:strand:- start:911 stop:1417 length:507 start_codon:yes stop_codon:yes gene_type:complete
MFQLFVLYATRISHIELRGCPGMGTTWTAKVLPCLFEDTVFVSSVKKHEQCSKENWKNFESDKLLVSNCTKERNCLHVVVSRHPMSLKFGKAQREWETYYGGWMKHSHRNVKFFRFESLLQSGCTAKYGKEEVRERVIKLEARTDFVPLNETIWRFWNYTYAAMKDEV